MPPPAPLTRTQGLHHVTLITRRVQANVDFYVGFLGLSLVKRSAGFEDGEQLHLVYGDPAGAPGTLITFLVWEDGAPGRVGLGQWSDLALAVPADTLGDWLTRALAAGIRAEGPGREFGLPVLRLKDPDGITVKLVGAGGKMRLHSATLLTDSPEATAASFARLGWRMGPQEGAVQRMVAGTDTGTDTGIGALDIRAAAGFVPGIPGTGTADHVALRLPDRAALDAAAAALRAEGVEFTPPKDRRYFTSLYLREPGGALVELATDTPGMAVDEPEGALGRQLMIPPHDAHRAADLRVMLPQFALPGKERFPMRSLDFTHRFHRPDDPDGSLILHLHGTGGNEADLMPLAHRLNPRATLLGVRGRSTEEGVARWFRRLDLARFDQADIRAEAEAFAAFLDEAVASYALDPARITWLGYSNGANFIGALMGLQPGRVRRAILLRAMIALEDPPAVDLSDAAVLMLTGSQDPYARFAPPLEDWLRQNGAQLDARAIPGGHGLTQADLDAAQAWLTAPD